MEKRRGFFLLILFLCCHLILLSSSVQLQGGEFKAGARVMYGWWKPFLANYLQQLDRKLPVETTLSVNGSSLLYGPTLSYRFNQSWKMSLGLIMALHNQFKAFSNNITLDMTGLHAARSYKNHIEKYDGELKAHYTVNKFFDIFFGINVQTDLYYGKYYALVVFSPLVPLPDIPLSGSLRSSHYDCGPGLGAAVTLEPVKNFTVTANFSLYIMAGTLMRKIQFTPEKENIHIAIKSIDEIVFSYFYDTSRITLSAGFRYHVVIYALIESNPTEHFHNYTTFADQLYGITVSLSYAF